MQKEITEVDNNPFLFVLNYYLMLKIEIIKKKDNQDLFINCVELIIVVVIRIYLNILSWRDKNLI